MKPSFLIGPLRLAVALLLAGCSPSARPPAPASEAAQEPQPPGPPASAMRTKVIGLEGLGDLRLGHAPPEGGTWAARGAQVEGSCQAISSPDYPGVYAIVANGQVRRITVGQGSNVTLAEGFGVGASERDVYKWFAGFRVEPHKYEPSPAKYLTAPNAAASVPAIRFEIGQDGAVRLLHVGMMPELGFVEGCA